MPLPYTLPFVLGQIVAPGSFAGHGGLSATATAKFAAPAPLAGHGALTATATPKVASAASSTGHGALSAAARMYQIRESASLAGHGGLSATATAKIAAPAALPGAGALTAAARMYQIRLAVALTGHGSLSAATIAKLPTAPSLTGHGALTVAAIPKSPDSAALHGLGVLVAVARMYQIQLTAGLAGHGALSATAKPKFAAPANLHGTGTLVASGTSGTPRSAALSGHGALSATAKPKFKAAASLAGHGALAATARQTVSQHAALPGVGTLSVAVKAIASSHPTLNGAGALKATITVIFTQAAAVTGQGALTATATPKFARAAALTGQGALSTTIASWVLRPTALSGAGQLAATAHSVKFILPAHLTGRGTLTAGLGAIASDLTFFEVTGFFYAMADPSISGIINSPTIQPVNGTVTFTPRLTRGQAFYVSNYRVSRGRSAEQTINLIGNPTGGTWTLEFSGFVTDPLPWNATPAQVQEALEALLPIEPGDVSVAVGSQPATYEVGFGGSYVGQFVSVMLGNGDLLTNARGAFCEVTVAPTALGSAEVMADTAIVLETIPAKIINGIICTDNYGHTPGIQLVSNSAILNLGGDLIYDVAFVDVTYNGASRTITPFAFVAPADAAALSITSPAAQRLPYVSRHQSPYTTAWNPTGPPPLNTVYVGANGVGTKPTPQRSMVRRVKPRRAYSR